MSAEERLAAAWEDGFRAAMDGEAWNASDERNRQTPLGLVG